MSSQFGVPAANCNLVRRWSQQGGRRGEESMEEKLRKGGQTIYEKNGMSRTQNTTYLLTWFKICYCYYYCTFNCLNRGKNV